MKTKGRKFWTALVLLGLVGQVAWVVENMYLNVFLYKMFNASAADISLMVGASSVAATLTTILVGAFSDKVGKRKLLMCLGYIIWGISILGFGMIKVETLTPIAGSVAAAASLGVTLVIVLDCVMTFFGSAANDAAYNAWLTDKGDDSNRGKIEGFNSMMPLVAILVVFGGFMGFNLDLASSWSWIFAIIGGVVIVLGALGIFLIEEAPTGKLQTGNAESKERVTYLENVLYSFRIRTFKDNKFAKFVVNAIGIKDFYFTPDQLTTSDMAWSARGCKYASTVISRPVDNPIPGGLYYKEGDLVADSLDVITRLFGPKYYSEIFTDMKNPNGSIKKEQDIYCTKEGVFPVNGEFLNCDADAYFTANTEYSVGTFIYTEDNLYYVTTAGTSGETASTHEEGIVENGTVQLLWVAPIARYEMRDKVTE